MPDWYSGLGYVELLPELCYSVDVTELPSKILIEEEDIQDEYIQHNKGKCLWGQLTLIGQEQSITFGKELRRIYMNGCKFLQEEFHENEILCRSTKFPRTYFTLKGILSGLYGSNSFDMCHRPIIYTTSISNDPMYPNSEICPVIGQFIAVGSLEIAKDKEIIKMKCLLKRLLGVENLEYSSPESGKNINRCDKNKEKTNQVINDHKVTIYAVRDDLYSRQVHDFDVPSAFSALYPEINRLSSQEILYEYLGGANEWEERMAILVSPPINFIKSNMKKVTDEIHKTSGGKPCIVDMKDSIMKEKVNMKMQLLACHDTTLIPLLVCFRIYDGQWPSFMANLIIELYKEKDSGNLFTRILYNGRVQNLKVSETSCGVTNEYGQIGLLPYNDLLILFDKYSFADNNYESACDKALKLFSAGKSVNKANYI